MPPWVSPRVRYLSALQTVIAAEWLENSLAAQIEHLFERPDSKLQTTVSTGTSRVLQTKH